METKSRKPVVAGQFYPGRRDNCLNEIDECIRGVTAFESLPENIVAGIVPHAGWVFSGSLAASVFLAIKQRHENVHTFVIFGAVHSYSGRSPAVYESGNWNTPLGPIDIDHELAKAVLTRGAAVSNFKAHDAEHSIEVLVPFIQKLFPDAKILPILTPPVKQSFLLGEQIGVIICQLENKKIICLGSTDLTHYGPRYGFAPMGSGRQALRWASDVNDRKFIDLALELKPQDILSSAAKNKNACGAGAAAAAVAVAKGLGVTQGVLLAHTNSNEIALAKMMTSSQESVGYAAIVY